MAPFFTILTPLSYIPVLFGVFIGAWSCLGIILNTYGVDLEMMVPWISGGSGNVAGPILLAGIAAFGFTQGAIIRNRKPPKSDAARTRFGPLGWLERLSVLAMIGALLTVPFWLPFSRPEIWSISIGIVILIIWRKSRR